MYDCINITDTDCTMFNEAEIRASFDYIKCGKAAGLDGSGECIKFAHPCLRVLLKEFLRHVVNMVMCLKSFVEVM